jgi:DNA-binding response OmpR family regulator
MKSSLYGVCLLASPVQNQYTTSMTKGAVLIVEDEKRIADISRAYLERDGYEVTHAATGEEALGLLKKGFDLLILDLMLPDMDGEEICATVRKDSDIPIIMVTAKALLRRTKKQVKTMSFNGGELVVNMESHEVVSAGALAPLTPTEFKILKVMAERPQAVFSRLQLVNIVQGYDFEGYERTIDAHVKNLRQKIERNPKEPEFVKTVYALGYKFIGTRDAD